MKSAIIYMGCAALTALLAVANSPLLPVAPKEERPRAPSEVDPERWLDTAQASPPPPDWSNASTPGLSIIVPSFARPDNLLVQLAYLLRLPVLQLSLIHI